MKRADWLKAGSVLFVAGLVLSQPVRADFELTGPDGRRILLKDDRSWQYVESKDKAKEAGEEKEKDKAKEAEEEKEREKEKERAKIREEGEAVLRLVSREEIGGSCRFVLLMVNNLRYQIISLVPQFIASNESNAVHDTVFAEFAYMKLGDSQRRVIQFRGVACRNIARVQVAGGDRCNMGELQKFAEDKGRCLARVRVIESDLVRFEK